MTYGHTEKILTGKKTIKEHDSTRRMMRIYVIFNFGDRKVTGKREPREGFHTGNFERKKC